MLWLWLFKTCCLPTWSWTLFNSRSFPGTHWENIYLDSYPCLSLCLLFLCSAWLDSLLLIAWQQTYTSRKEVPLFLPCLALGSTQDEFLKMEYWMACPWNTAQMGMPLCSWFQCRYLLWKSSVWCSFCKGDCSHSFWGVLSE